MDLGEAIHLGSDSRSRSKEEGESNRKGNKVNGGENADFAAIDDKGSILLTSEKCTEWTLSRPPKGMEAGGLIHWPSSLLVEECPWIVYLPVFLGALEGDHRGSVASEKDFSRNQGAGRSVFKDQCNHKGKYELSAPTEIRGSRKVMT